MNDVRDVTATVMPWFPRPTTLMWNRLEGRPRARDFHRALKAEIRDPLWLLTRQWQTGEFIAEDAGSPIIAKVAYTTDQLTDVKGAKGPQQPFTLDLPLEAATEALPAPFGPRGRADDGALRLSLGRRWQKMVRDAGHDGLMDQFFSLYPFVPVDPDAEGDRAIAAHAGAFQFYEAVAGRAVDGGAIWAHLADGGDAANGISSSPPVLSEIAALGGHFLEFVRAQFVLPSDEIETWKPRHLEYGVEVGATDRPTSGALSAPEYRGGRLDWFHFDAAPAEATPLADGERPVHGAVVTSFIPAEIEFDGMPNTRHWTFEEGLVNFGDIRPDTTDIAKLLLIEFGLIYANDWFLLPITAPIGSLTRIEGLTVTNVFGERFLIDPAVSDGSPSDRWQMFRLSDKGRTDDRLFLPPAAPTGLESAPVEAVALVRDEVANMVWGVEKTVQMADGRPRPGREVGHELRVAYEAQLPSVASPPTIENEAKVKYTLQTSVGEHWIPFVPVHMENDNREIQLQRAAMPRLLPGDMTPLPVEPRTRLLREGLDFASPAPYFIAEEEVERAGTVVETRWQRCRWLDGRVVLWLSHQRKTGRGEAASGLAFDVLDPKPKPGPPADP
ncbi:MAG: hypothetical protein AAF582_01565 [Pseudomonadota bacterium]